MASESTIVAEIRVRLSSLGIVAWVNSCGVADEGDRKVTYGLCRGSSDLIGIRRSDGKFVAIEAKSPSGMRAHCAALATAQVKLKSKSPMTKSERHAYEQLLFVQLVLACGGIAGFADSADAAEAICSTRR